jgi:hypothetical protein
MPGRRQHISEDGSVCRLHCEDAVRESWGGQREGIGDKRGRGKAGMKKTLVGVREVGAGRETGL